MACTKDHEAGGVPRRIESLEDSQRGFWRHKCAGCAYEMGYKDAGEAAERLREQMAKLREEKRVLEKRIGEMEATRNR